MPSHDPLGSKEGITTPPGQATYSVSKAAIKVLTEQLEHELRNATGGRVAAHLLVPGYTFTPMNFPAMGDSKPDASWRADQLVDDVITRLLNGDFYILCPDNEATSQMDRKRILWSAQDMILNRPALSRWHAGTLITKRCSRNGWKAETACLCHWRIDWNRAGWNGRGCWRRMAIT
ncbi:MAG: SDR family NAD(P)-dependent oxidoreductase [Paracoccus sp. (in: a-proteobacteria)]|uniref:SDR family NAD(P)-dependent oxidoreductase n=1 Tax=Paracoccus sp. TaxID=267 RepID=UPI0026DEC922|nr:SDR family NAD(P)-dependent oxidoreductase [Paracoccus sp. (in: a-proteobacteria)]MDO5632329.1 SDR family NAD(P)-dependent oxidoreductase [Paracoccus sp. (in: a-proteobacteria)]